MEFNSKIIILTSHGPLGCSLGRYFKKQGCTQLLIPSSSELNLLDQKSVLEYFEKYKPDYVIHAAAKVGGIQANRTFPADFIFENLSMQNHVFEACFKNKVEKLVFLGSSCIYPRLCSQPIKEEYLLTGELEKTSEPYAIAKIAGIKMAESFRKQYGLHYISLVPAGVYGDEDSFDSQNSHVIPSLINRMKKTIDQGDEFFEIWGTGTALREFLYVDDLASACYFIMNYEGELPLGHLNVGTGEEISIAELAKHIGKIMGYKGRYVFNTNYPDGTPRKLLDITRIKNLGWKAEVNLEEGLKKNISHFMTLNSRGLEID